RGSKLEAFKVHPIRELERPKPERLEPRCRRSRRDQCRVWAKGSQSQTRDLVRQRATEELIRSKGRDYRRNAQAGNRECLRGYQARHSRLGNYMDYVRL